MGAIFASGVADDIAQPAVGPPAVGPPAVEQSAVVNEAWPAKLAEKKRIRTEEQARYDAKQSVSPHKSPHKIG